MTSEFWYHSQNLQFTAKSSKTIQHVLRFLKNQNFARTQNTFLFACFTSASMSNTDKLSLTMYHRNNNLQTSSQSLFPVIASNSSATKSCYGLKLPFLNGRECEDTTHAYKLLHIFSFSTAIESKEGFDPQAFNG